jgi:hypothetical protein
MGIAIFDSRRLKHRTFLHMPKTQLKWCTAFVHIYSPTDLQHIALCILFAEMNPEFVSAMKHVFLELLDDDADVDNTLDFVPSLTPQEENLKVIFASQPSVLQHSATEMPSSADILKQDFTKTTMKHLINPQR